MSSRPFAERSRTFAGRSLSNIGTVQGFHELDHMIDICFDDSAMFSSVNRAIYEEDVSPFFISNVPVHTDFTHLYRFIDDSPIPEPKPEPEPIITTTTTKRTFALLRPRVNGRFVKISKAQKEHIFNQL